MSPWICEECGHNFGWDTPKTKRGSPYKRCPSCHLEWHDFDIEDGYGHTRHYSIPFRPVEGKATDEQLKELAGIYSTRHSIPIDIAEEFFLHICGTDCSSGHFGGMCIHNLECLEQLLFERGFM